MKRLLNCVLLIDDDENDNFFHKRIIQKAQIAHKIDTVENGEEAIAYLTTKVEGKYPQPDLIFLDINMPRMNGWEFLEAYEKLEPNQQGRTIVIMLTTSLNPTDIDKAQTLDLVNGYHIKPLNKEMLLEILKSYFPDFI